MVTFERHVRNVSYETNRTQTQDRKATCTSRRLPVSRALTSGADMSDWTRTYQR